VVVACNLGDERAVVPDVSGTVRLSTIRERDGEVLSGSVPLEPWEAVILVRS
jgi:hypothetical protein